MINDIVGLDLKTIYERSKETIFGVVACKMCFCDTKTLVPVRQGL
jgi:hypothetical protein